MAVPSPVGADPVSHLRHRSGQLGDAPALPARVTEPQDRGTSALLGRRRECAALDEGIEEARSRRSATLVVNGEAGSGKSALLDYVRASAVDFLAVRCCGVESEMELAYAGLHQLCSPLMGRIDQLPEPQRNALQAALALAEAPVPDQFLVCLAALNLLAQEAERHPLLCLVDDAQWLDHASLQAVAFIGRRLAAEPIAVV